MKAMMLGAGLVAAATAFGSLRAVTPIAWERGDTNCWQQVRHREKLQQVAAGGAKVVFIGDSITHFWETNGKLQLQKYFSDGDYRMLDLGTSADRTEHVLWRLVEGKELDGYEAKAVVLMIGTNNTGHRHYFEEPDRETPIDTILGISEVLRVIREKQPRAKVVLTSIFPRGHDDDDDLRRRNDVVNREICKLADGKDVFWCDFSDQLLTADGVLLRSVMPDLLHPGRYGYEVWAAAVKPYLDYALSDGRLPAPPNRFANRIRRGAFRGPDVTALNPTTRFEARWQPGGRRNWWAERLLQHRTQIVDSNREFDLVMLGDSITHFWETAGTVAYAELTNAYSVLNLGYSGDCTQNAIWRAENGEFDGYRAKCVMVMIGTNNSSLRYAPADTAKGVERLLAVIAEKQPQAKVLLLPVFPRGASPEDPVRRRNDELNQLLARYADGQRVRWVDFNAKFLDAQGDVRWAMSDRLHPNQEGYAQVWLPAVKPYLKDIVGK